MEKNDRSGVMFEWKKNKKPKRVFFEHQMITTVNC